MASQHQMAFEFQADGESCRLRVLNQTLLPDREEYVEIKDTSDAFEAIAGMKVRGAPCIAAVACLSFAVELGQPNFYEKNQSKEMFEIFKEKAAKLISSRPTAVNLRNALENLGKLIENASSNLEERKQSIESLIVEHCNSALRSGLEANLKLAEFGYQKLVSNVQNGESLTILTHCNTGSLATVGHGTAYGVIKTLHCKSRLKHVYFTETRPYNQGSRLTALELNSDKIVPATLVLDSMVAWLMQTRRIDAVIVGADRVTANGDTANKIGTLQIATIAREFRVPFFVATPIQTLDLRVSSMDGVEIEERPASEVFGTESRLTSISAWNPSFDVTPARLITGGYITQIGVFQASELANISQKSAEAQLEF